ncbi:Stp1/IreP family PP2C-type Ser/Thr phosphatase [Haliangium sp. UPWRP_2]|uniref:Stp1/IreP family PP2C-type Ser/Thr phosphatase n=1 Tax=Haliangium sp. UPWRP_2 TaxID=1931276 RepID=UPI000B54414E|nr:Stp1/IreP family PP2C-type Ser/Thr phosphatase [Haliangium sp. UPWRP_2]PSM31197.1 Stp1/IreP family PP2C-type Ser/Thr phosphatase [Haliangium sp. UPWRP_2]
MRLIPYALSDVGRKRQHNEDSYLVAPQLSLFAVADGMGGHRAGEKASRMAVERLRDSLIPPKRSAGKDEVLAHLQKAMYITGAAIFDAAQSDPDLAGMGTTLTSVLVHSQRAYVAHVGDSRCYLFRDGKISQITTDHSWVAEQVKAGLLTEQEARESRFRHIITRSVGFEREVQVDGTVCPVQSGDCLILCSDGLSNYLEEDDFADVMSRQLYSDAPRVLIDLANARGGDDNITVVIIHLANDADAVA